LIGANDGPEGRGHPRPDEYRSSTVTSGIYNIFGDIEGKLTMLHVECTRCSRKGRYNVSKLIAQYGARGI
jgi:hypothetical protein